MLTLLATSTYVIVLWVIGGLTLLGIVMWPFSYLYASQRVYVCTLRRGGINDWSRGHASCTDPEQLAMYEIGMEWHAQNVHCKRDLTITNKNLKLFGEYYDFGSDKCVIVLSGRTETLEYGYYFAIPYAKMGYNVLVVDPRAHGLSEGEFNTVGFEESTDYLAWANYVHDELGVKSIIYHGICIGSAAALYALTSDNCPDYIKGMVAEGMFANFGESMKEHLIERKKPVFLLNSMIDMWMRHYTGHSMKVGPIDVIDKMHKPLLMLHSKEDIYSTPAFAQKLFDKAQSPQKELVWFEHGRHSMVRINNTEKYDQAITDFVTKNF